MFKRRTSLMAGIAAIALVVSACGSDEPAAAPTSTAAPSSSAPSSAASSAGSAAPTSAAGQSGTVGDAAAPVDAPQALVDAAKGEGSVVWYTSIPQAPVDAAVAAFQAKYGVTVEVVRLGSEVIEQRYATERDAGNVVGDVLTVPEAFILSEYKTKGWLEPITPETVPALNPWPAQYFYDDSFALVNIQPIGIAFNTDSVTADELTGWESLLDPKFSGKIALADPGAILSWTEVLRIVQGSLGDAYLTGLKGQAPQIQASAIPATQQVAAGDSLIAFPSLLSVVNPLKAEGAPIDIKFFNPTTGVQQFVAISAGAPHPNASKLLTNYLMSAEGQAVLNKDVASSVLPDIAGTVPLPENYVLPDLVKAAAAKDSILGLLGIG